MRVNLDVQSLRSFIKVAEVKNFTRAAELINLTQPAISQQIRRLEELLDTPLFARQNKQVLLTPAGEQLLKHAREIVESNDRIAELFHSKNKKEVVTLGMPEHFCEMILPQIIASMAARLPAVQIVVKVARSALLSDAVNEGKIDIGLVIDEAEKMQENVWHNLAIKWCVSEEIDISDKNEVPLALFKAPCGFRNLAIKSLEDQGISWRCAYESEDLISLRSAVKAGIGVTVLPWLAEQPGLKSFETFSHFPQLPHFAVGLKQRDGWNPAWKEELIDLIQTAWSTQYQKRECFPEPGSTIPS
ncbi:LysR family transcriptional regulator [Erwinia sp. BNK-24-b]|uniref:LysR family transcriptional regulator n=1 Tax=unclassified Erwinia TaxID=2622719 RepID=UPI0039BFBC0A